MKLTWISCEAMLPVYVRCICYISYQNLQNFDNAIVNVIKKTKLLFSSWPYQSGIFIILTAYFTSFVGIIKMPYQFFVSCSKSQTFLTTMESTFYFNFITPRLSFGNHISFYMRFNTLHTLKGIWFIKLNFLNFNVD